MIINHSCVVEVIENDLDGPIDKLLVQIRDANLWKSSKHASSFNSIMLTTSSPLDILL